MRKRIVITTALAMFLTGTACLPWAAAQDTAKQVEPQPKPTDSYKVEFTVNELENGKKINSRSYLMLVRADAIPKFTDMKHLRVGSKVPYATGTGANSIQYQDVGMNIDCRLLPMGNGNVVIDTNWDYSSVGGEQGVNHDTQNPVFRQVRSSVEAVVPADKPTVIAEMDDVASTHRYVFEVKVTKLNP
ncbi:MAG: hypothetical protein ABSF71_02865 [Terriglobia bacterium]